MLDDCVFLGVEFCARWLTRENSSSREKVILPFSGWAAGCSGSDFGSGSDSDSSEGGAKVE